MIEATPGYMKWANVREMHQLSAVGTVKRANWLDSGPCELTVKVVDDQAWEKVKEGVYKGFSVGVVPRVMDGLSVTQCDWVETSLVDRPKDWDAIYTEIRTFDSLPAEAEVTEDPGPLDSADLPDSAAETEIAAEGEVSEEDSNESKPEALGGSDEQRGAAPKIHRGSLMDRFRDGQAYRDWSAAHDLLWSALYDIVRQDEISAEEKALRAGAACDDFKEIVLGVVSRAQDPGIFRSMEAVSMPSVELIQPAEVAEVRRSAPIQGVSGEKTRPVLNAKAVERVMAYETGEPQKSSIAEQIAELERSPGATAEERKATSLRISQLKSGN